MNDEEGPAFLDTNVLVYAHETDQSARGRAARELLLRLAADNRIRIRLSTQVLQELYVTLTRKTQARCTPEQAIRYLAALRAWPLFEIDYPAILRAAELSRDAQLSFWDALIIVAAARSGAARLYTEDLSHGQEILGVAIVNPFHGIGEPA